MEPESPVKKETFLPEESQLFLEDCAKRVPEGSEEEKKTLKTVLADMTQKTPSAGLHEAYGAVITAVKDVAETQKVLEKEIEGAVKMPLDAMQVEVHTLQQALQALLASAPDVKLSYKL